MTQHAAADAKPKLRPAATCRGECPRDDVYMILCRYVPVGLLEEQYIYRLNDRPAPYVGTSLKQPTIFRRS